MANYIDGDALVRKMMAMRKFGVANDYDRGWEDALTEVCVAIDSVHGIKLPEMVEHGKWVRDIGLWQCSCCKLHWAGRTQYCPACGARLEAENG